MKTKKIKIYMVLVFAMFVAFTSCINDLNTIPLDEDITTGATVYDNPEAYRQVLAKCYAGLATTGQEGPAGNPDVGGIDEGFSSYLRGLWNLQELPTEEAITGWGDDGLQDLHAQIWTSNNDFVKGLYYRIFYQIAIANELIRESADAKLDERGVADADKTTIHTYQAEARFLRALSYWHALDMFVSVPFVTEDDGVGAFFPEQATPSEMFDYIESELLAIEPLMVEPKANQYGRADRAAVWMLLANLYLNSEVYTGTDHYADAATYSKKVIDAGYELDPTYGNLFLADNNTAKGIIFAVPFDGVHTKTWGGTTFIIDGSIGGSMVPADYGVSETWGGHRATSALVEKFPQYAPEKSVNIAIKNSVNDYPVLYLPGNYQIGAGYSVGDWDPASAPVLYSKASDGSYEGYIYFPDNTELKVCEGPNWDANWGDLTNDGILDTDANNNIKIAEAGMYKINVNMTTKEIAILKTTWSIIGGAVPPYDWSADINLTLDPVTHLWSVVASLKAGEFKFRANNAWDIDFGMGDDGYLAYGSPTNLSIAETGKYLVTLDLNNGDYTYSLEKFSSDERAMFYTDGQTLDIDLVPNFTNGYAVTKWKNITKDGVAGSDPVHCDTDFPLFRLAEAYLIYAEAAVRGGGDLGLALTYVNKVRTRAYTDESGNIAAGELTLDFLIDERARELFWEAHRRTDLVRFGLLTGDTYIWQWKGGVKEGKGTDSKYNYFPIPASDIIANPNLVPSEGY